MRKLYPFLALLLLALTVPPVSRAELGAVDAVPAATLLLPYFEVGLENSGDSRTTLFSINNAKSESVVVHVTLWTILARPSLDFDVFLTGYDVQTYNLADLFLRGGLPQTPVLPPGQFSEDNEVPASCQFPLPNNLPPILQSYLRNVHTGLPAPAGFANGGLCGAPSQGEGDAGDFVAKGYITMDVVNDCSQTFPGDEGYFGDGGTGVISNNNAIWGDFFLVDPDNAFAQGDNLVHIEAMDSVAEGFWEAGDYTFYGRYTNFDGSDNREPLATTWATRYFAGTTGPFVVGSDLFVWRDSALNDSEFFQCGTIPAPYPLEQESVLMWDEEENHVSINDSPFLTQPNPSSFPLPLTPPLPPARPFPLAADRVSVAEIGPLFFNSGWLRLNLNFSTGSPQDPIKQSFVSAMHSASGQFSVGFQAVALDSALDKTFLVTTAPETTEPGLPGV
ncbi:MAG: hypothetical protein K0U98_15100 [Deltaproteobacteria bacterium]|nr:hypothetical protein [Deltaproteobacteria bacterium]